MSANVLPGSERAIADVYFFRQMFWRAALRSVESEVAVIDNSNAVDDKEAEIDIWRSAKQLVDQYAQDASLEAAMRADVMLEQGDLDGQAVWKRIRKTVEDLLVNNQNQTLH